MAKQKVKGHSINQSWCKGCGICVHFCPKQVLALNEYGLPEVQAAEQCIGCRLCEYRCPDLCIEVLMEEQ